MKKTIKMHEEKEPEGRRCELQNRATYLMERDQVHLVPHTKFTLF
jgi:hypothetical protein